MGRVMRLRGWQLLVEQVANTRGIALYYYIFQSLQTIMALLSHWVIISHFIMEEQLDDQGRNLEIRKFHIQRGPDMTMSEKGMRGQLHTWRAAAAHYHFTIRDGMELRSGFAQRTYSSAYQSSVLFLCQFYEIRMVVVDKKSWLQ